MKRVSIKLGALALLAGAALLVSPTKASAAVVNVQIGGPPPPPPAYVPPPWARPHRSAVWIQGHYEVVNGRWVWINGYYGYPPHGGMHWIPGRYKHGYWRPGYWAY